jgi:hypothetical protein
LSAEKREKSLKCPICGQETGGQDYCQFHKEVYEIFLKKYYRWKKAMDISWKEYLSKIAQNSLTGEWAKEVVQYLIEVDDERDVKKG